ncbi:MAG: tetratricopeptide repeat protein, partial [Anaerolineae bacterium]
LRAAPDIKILVTSRTRLHLQEEWVLSLHGLQYPQTENEDAETFDAVTLFMQRARQLKSDFDLESEKAHILRICQLVEGMPLGLELAAAWVRQIPCETIAQEIESEIDFLSTNLRNLPDRHRSIRAVFAYSWQKLDSREQAVLKKLSVFRGGFERDAAKAVAGASLLLLSGLVDKSLLSVTKSGRYMIHELLRQFAAEKLSDSSDSFETQGLHSRFYFTFLEKQERPIKGPQGRAAVKAIEREIDNIRNSIHWALDHNRQLFTMSAGFTLSLFFEIQGWFREGEVTFHLIANALKVDCENALPEELPSSSISPITLHWAQCNVHWGRFQWRLGELNQADETLQNSLSHLPPENLSARWTRGYAFWILGAVAAYRMDFTRSISLIKKGRQLFKDAGDLWGYAGTLMFLGQVMHNAGDYDEAQLVLEMTAGILEQLGEQYMTGFNLSDRGRVAAHFGELAQAETYHQAALAQRMKLGTRTGIAISLRDLGNISRLRGKYEEAQSYYQQSLILAQDANMPYSIQDSVFQLGNLAVAKGNFAEAKRHFQESSTLLRYGDASGGIGWAALGLGELEEAKGQFLTALQKMVEGGSKPVGLDSLVGIAHLLAQTGNLSRALELLTLVNRHSASNYEIKEKVRMLWEELVAELSPELIAEAEARGRELDLFETAENLLAEESNI